MHRPARGALRRRGPASRKNLRGRRTIDVPLALLLLATSALKVLSFLLSRPVSPRCCPGGSPVAVRRCSEVDREISCVCRLFLAFSARTAPSCTRLAQSLFIEYCCPVSRPDWPRRDRLRNFAPAAIQASRSSSVIDWLYFLEAAAKRARQLNCLGVRGSFGLTYRCRCCFPFRTYHTQSPHRPLLRPVAKHSPQGPRWGQRRHAGLRGRSRALIAFRAWEPFGVGTFIIRHVALVNASEPLRHRVGPPIFLRCHGF